MGNCLKTQLKAVVANENLLNIGEIVVEFGVSADLTNAWNRIIVLGGLPSGVSTKLRILGDGYFTDSTFTQNLGRTLEVVGDAEAYVSNVATKVAIGYNYRLGTLIVGYDGTFDIDQLKFNQYTNTAALRLLNPNGGGRGDINSVSHMFSERTANTGRIEVFNSKAVAGNIETFDFTHISIFRASSTSITGSVESLSAPNITQFEITLTNVTGSIENMLVSILNSGKIGQVSMNLRGDGLTWNGISGGLLGNVTVIFATNSITVAVGSTTKGTYDGTSWTYNN